jgi:hypothetical protein
MAFTRTYYYDGIQELSRWDPVRTQHNNS